eukprot:UN04437
MLSLRFCLIIEFRMLESKSHTSNPINRMHLKQQTGKKPHLQNDSLHDDRCRIHLHFHYRSILDCYWHYNSCPLQEKRRILLSLVHLDNSVIDLHNFSIHIRWEIFEILQVFSPTI